MNKKSQLIGTWAGPLTIVLFGLSFWPFAGFLPPLSPTMPVADISAYYQEHATGIRFGMLLMMFAGSLNCVFVGAISTQLRRIEKDNPMWTYGQLAAGCAGSVIIIVGAMLMTAVAFRPDRGPELTYLLFDLSWIMVVMPGTPAAVQNFTIGFAILSDKSMSPVFPRWLGFFNIWTGLLFLPGALVTFFKTGPFAWNGLLAFWLPAALFGPWFFVMFFMMRKAIRQQA
jgi:hypothetical protein